MSPLDLVPACTADPELFFPHSGQNASAAKAVCLECPFRMTCLEIALTTHSDHDDHGVWGGTTPKERRVLRGSRRASEAA